MPCSIYSSDKRIQKLELKVENLENIIKEQNIQIDKLKDMVNAIYYHPKTGPGYLEAEENYFGTKTNYNTKL